MSLIIAVTTTLEILIADQRLFPLYVETLSKIEAFEDHDG